MSTTTETEITTITPLLIETNTNDNNNDSNKHGQLTHPGFARKPFFRYDRNHINAHWSRIKEWDYYSILNVNEKFGISITLADLGLIGLAAVVFMDLETGKSTQVDSISLFPKGSIGLGKQSYARTGIKGDVVMFQSNKLQLVFNYEMENVRILSFYVPNFPHVVSNTGSGTMIGRIELVEKPNTDSMTIATSWKESPTCFYHNTKVNNLIATGGFCIGEKQYLFSSPSTATTNLRRKDEPSFAVLDWGRGVWPWEKNATTWYWSSLSGIVDGHTIGWNLGYGFSDRSPASENMVFVNGKSYKLHQVQFHVDSNDWMKPWRFITIGEGGGEGMIDVTMTPVIDRSFKLDLKLVKTVQHQVYGKFTGIVKVGEQKFLLNEIWAFAEVVENRW
jgi:hypothetical protein